MTDMPGIGMRSSNISGDIGHISLDPNSTSETDEFQNSHTPILKAGIANGTEFTNYAKAEFSGIKLIQKNGQDDVLGIVDHPTGLPTEFLCVNDNFEICKSTLKSDQIDLTNITTEKLFAQRIQIPAIEGELQYFDIANDSSGLFIRTRGVEDGDDRLNMQMKHEDKTIYFSIDKDDYSSIILNVDSGSISLKDSNSILDTKGGTIQNAIINSPVISGQMTAQSPAFKFGAYIHRPISDANTYETFSLYANGNNALDFVYKSDFNSIDDFHHQDMTSLMSLSASSNLDLKGGTISNATLESTVNLTGKAYFISDTFTQDNFITQIEKFQEIIESEEIPDIYKPNNPHSNGDPITIGESYKYTLMKANNGVDFIFPEKDGLIYFDKFTSGSFINNYKHGTRMLNVDSNSLNDDTSKFHGPFNSGFNFNNADVLPTAIRFNIKQLLEIMIPILKGVTYVTTSANYNTRSISLQRPLDNDVFTYLAKVTLNICKTFINELYDSFRSGGSATDANITDLKESIGMDSSDTIIFEQTTLNTLSGNIGTFNVNTDITFSKNINYETSLGTSVDYYTVWETGVNDKGDLRIFNDIPNDILHNTDNNTKLLLENNGYDYTPSNTPSNTSRTTMMRLQNVDNSCDISLYSSIGFGTYHYIEFEVNDSGNKARILDSMATDTLDFTGQHRCIPDDFIFSVDKIGCIVSTVNKYKHINSNSKNKINNIKINESIPCVQITRKKKDKCVFGVISNGEDNNESTRDYQQGMWISSSQKNKDDTRIYINSLGEGAIWVSDFNGPLESGDYITSSDIPGIGMKQDSEFLTNYTVAKITMDCEFEPVIESSMIWNDEKEEYQQKINEQGETEYVPEYNMKYIKIDGTVIEKHEYDTLKTEGEQVYRMAFVGCTYHCG